MEYTEVWCYPAQWTLDHILGLKTVNDKDYITSWTMLIPYWNPES